MVLVSLLKAAFPRRNLAARATRLPIVGDALRRWLFLGDDLVYLPETRVIELGIPLERPEETVLPHQLVERFIERAGFIWQMNKCICRDASGCRDYPVDFGCLFLGEAAKEINPALGRPVTREEALEYARACRDAGLVHLVGRNKMDTVWLGVGPGNRLLTICHCCPCCCLWKALPHVSREISGAVSRLPGVSVSVAEDCTGCGACARDTCFVNAITVHEGRANISDACRGCGRCVAECPSGAIRLEYQGAESVDAAFQRLSELVRVD